MKKEMRTLYIEGLATHGGPESCVGVREGVGEALAGVRVGRAMEPRNFRFGVPTLSKKRKAMSPAALFASCSVDPARSENQGMYGVFMRENREGPCLPGGLIARRAVQGTLRRYA